MTDPSTSLYREIPLTRGQLAIVDADNFEWLSKYKWCAMWNKGLRGFYAVRISSRKDGPRHLILMHREILGLAYGDEREGDHVDPAKSLVNTRSNLRFATRMQQQWNQRRMSTNTSGYKGVWLSAQSGKYHAAISVNGKSKYLGRRDNPKDAFALVCAAAEKYHGEFARTE